MGQQVISITTDGTVSGLQRKPGQGIDLRKLGPANITRASLIEWDEDRQAWYIDVLQEAGKGKVTIDDLLSVGIAPHHAKAMCSGHSRFEDGLLLFAEYDDAVKVEIAYLDALRLKGQF